MRKILVGLIALMLPLAVLAQTGNRDLWSKSSGTWKVNIAKSKYNPGPAPKSATVTVTDDHKITFEGMDSDGKSRNWSWTPELGKAVTVDGAENTTVTRESETANNFTDAWKGPDGPSTGKGVLSKDGKTITYVEDGTNAKGEHWKNIVIYEKQ